MATGFYSDEEESRRSDARRILQRQRDAAEEATRRKKERKAQAEQKELQNRIDIAKKLGVDDSDPNLKAIKEELSVRFGDKEEDKINEAKALQSERPLTEERAPLEIDVPWASAEEKEKAKQTEVVEPPPKEKVYDEIQKLAMEAFSQPEAPKRSGELELVDAEGKPVVRKYNDLVEANKQVTRWIYDQVGAIDAKEKAAIDGSMSRLNSRFDSYKSKIASMTGQADKESRNLAMGMLLEGVIDGLGMIAVAATTKGRAQYSKGKGVDWEMLNNQIDKRMKNQMAVLDAQFNFDQSVAKDEVLQAKYRAKAERDKASLIAGGAQTQISKQEKDVSAKEAALQRYKEVMFGAQKADLARKDEMEKQERTFALQEEEQRRKYGDKELERAAKMQRLQLTTDAKAIEGVKNRALKERLQTNAQKFEAIQNELNRINRIDLNNMTKETRLQLQSLEAEQRKLDRELKKDMLKAKMENSRTMKELDIKQKELDRISRETMAANRIDAKLLQGVRNADLKIRLQESAQDFKETQNELDRLLAMDKTELTLENRTKIAELRTRQQELDREVSKDLLEARLENNVVVQKLRNKQKEYTRLIDSGKDTGAIRKEIAELKIKADAEKAKLDREFRGASEDKKNALREKIEKLKIEANKEMAAAKVTLAGKYGSFSPSVALAEDKFTYKKQQDEEKKKVQQLGLGSFLTEIAGNATVIDKPVKLPAGRQLEKFPAALKALPPQARTAVANAIGVLKSEEGTKWHQSASDRRKARKTVKQAGEALSSGKKLTTTDVVRARADKEGVSFDAMKKRFEKSGYVIIED